MERKTIIFFIIICLLLGVLSASIKLSPEIKWAPDANIAALPDHIGLFKSEPVWFCQNEQCGHHFEASIIGDSRVCPDCGAPLKTVSIAEQKLLPAGTEIRKLRYRKKSGPSYYVSVVLSTKERRSIHQPQVCLKAQGYLIQKEQTINIELNMSHILKVRVLDLQPTPGSKLHPATFAYWFSSKDKETPSGWQRLLWIMQDRVLHNKASQWAYIGVMTSRRNGSDEHITRLKKFIAELYPKIKKEDYK